MTIKNNIICDNCRALIKNGNTYINLNHASDKDKSKQFCSDECAIIWIENIKTAKKK